MDQGDQTPGQSVSLTDMTRLLDQAIKEVRDLPEEEQDEVAEILLSFLSSDERQYRLCPITIKRK